MHWYHYIRQFIELQASIKTTKQTLYRITATRRQQWHEHCQETTEVLCTSNTGNKWLPVHNVTTSYSIVNNIPNRITDMLIHYTVQVLLLILLLHAAFYHHQVYHKQKTIGNIMSKMENMRINDITDVQQCCQYDKYTSMWCWENAYSLTRDDQTTGIMGYTHMYISDTLLPR